MLGAAAGYGIVKGVGKLANKLLSKISARQTAELGIKLDYQLGKATGNEHNISRSKGLLKEMEKLGFDDNSSNRKYFQKYYNDVLNNGDNIILEEIVVYRDKTGSYIKTTRESFLMGKRGGAVVTTSWDGNRLLTMIIKSGEETRYCHIE